MITNSENNLRSIDERTASVKKSIADDIKKYINNVKESKKLLQALQRKINLLNDYKSYSEIMSDNELLLLIETLKKEAMLYIDIAAEEFESSLAGNCIERIFELVTYSHLKKYEELIFNPQQKQIGKNKRSEYPEYRIQINKSEYYVECTTATSSLFDKFVELLPNIDVFFEAARIICEDFEEKKRIYNRCPDSEWFYAVDCSIGQLSKDKQEKLKSITNSTTIKEVEDKISEFFYYIEYANCYYPDLIPQNILKEMHNIRIFKRSHLCDKGTLPLKKHIVEKIARAIIDKAKNEYFQSGIPVALFISFSQIPEFLRISHPEELIKFIIDNLPTEIKKQNQSNSILSNLYAVVLDTTWYNWFPDIAKSRHGAQFPEGKENMYVCFYNSNHPKVQEQALLFHKVAYHDFCAMTETRRYWTCV